MFTTYNHKHFVDSISLSPLFLSYSLLGAQRPLYITYSVSLYMQEFAQDFWIVGALTFLAREACDYFSQFFLASNFSQTLTRKLGVAPRKVDYIIR